MTTQMTMVERVARAMATQHWHDNCLWDGPFPSVEQYADDEWTLWETTARAAIAAMREPTEGMVNIGQNKCDDYLDAAECWAAMIDAALSEHQTQTRKG